MLRMVGAMLALIAGTPAILAHDHAFETPREVLGALYGAYVSGVAIRDFSPYFSEGLTKAMNGRVIGQLELAASGLEPFVGARPWQIARLRIDLVRQGEDAAEVAVSFTNFGKPVSLDFEMVREREEGWQIDRIDGRSGERTWCTNTIVDLAGGTTR